MTAARVHAVIAAALDDAELLERWRRHPERIRRFGVDPAEVDWQGLWHFSGLSTKVRHNPLRAELPLTFRVLKATALEIELFSEYAPVAERLRRRGRNSNEEKIEALEGFLGDWVDLSDRRHGLIWDVFRHEVAIHRLRAAAGDPSGAPPESYPVSLTTSTVPRIRGTLILHALRHDPQQVQELISGGTVGLDSLATEECLLGYWVDDCGGAPRLLRLDPLAFHLLASTDGRVSLKGLAERMRAVGIELADQELVGAFESLAGEGLIAFAEPRRSG